MTTIYNLFPDLLMVNVGLVKLDSEYFWIMLRDFISSYHLTKKIAILLSDFNIYKNISISSFDSNQTEEHILTLDRYYAWLKGEVFI